MRLNDAEFPAKNFLDGVKGRDGERLRARFVALTQRLADDGKLHYEHGHWLEDPFTEIYEFKPYAFRVMAFQVGE